MSANIERVNGKDSFFSVGINAWWDNLGKNTIQKLLTLEEAIPTASMEWEAVKRKLVDPLTGNELPVYGVFRSDNNAFFGAVKDRYTPIQNRYQFEFMDTILGEGGAHYETAGVIGKGEKVFMLANLSEEHDILGSGDKHKAYLGSVGSHDGSMSQRFFVTDVRMVCQNTVQMALNAANGSGVTARHTRGAVNKLEAGLKMLKKSKDTFKSTMEKLEILAQRRVDGEVVANTLARMFELDLTQEIPARTLNALETIKDLFEDNDNNAFPEFRGSAYNLLNGVTQWKDHFAEVRITEGKKDMSADTLRRESAMFGRGAEFKSQALDIIMESTANCPTRSLNRVYSVPVEEAKANPLEAILNQY